ncbi:MAG TPA: hypothetical protein VHK22_05075 [Gaiellaceae bacterium]|jgi:hypothetical protein|nr:hypothetical protein [Gaiellaceae bacterium]
MSTEVEVGKNEALFRAVNERIRDVSDGLEPNVPIEFICECSRQDCTLPIALTLGEYAAVRSEPTWFAVSPTHLWDASAERVLSENETYWVLEKDGVAGAVAEATDG